MPRSIDVAELTETRLSRWHIRLTFFCFIVLLADGIDGQTLGYMVPALAKAYGVPTSAFGPLFSANLLGFGAGCALFGWFADIWGRRPMINLCVITFGILTIAKAFAPTLEWMIFLQFIAGLALGGAFPHAFALVIEYTPKRWRATLLAFAGLGLSGGGVLGGIVAGTLMPIYGWQIMFYLGGIITLFLAIPLWIYLPESLRFLVVKGRHRSQQLVVLRQIFPNTPDSELPDVTVNERDEGVPVVQLFREKRAPITTLLWLATAFDLMTNYFFTFWMTALGVHLGMTPSQAIGLTLSYQIAAMIGPFLVGPMVDRASSANTVLAWVWGLAAVCCIGMAYVGASFGLVASLVFAAGVLVIGGHVGIAVVAGNYYPTFMRSTGIGWMVGFGRMAALIGPLFVGLFLAWKWEPSTVFIAVAVVPLGAAICFVLIGLIMRQSKSVPSLVPANSPSQAR
jgi:AAHS family 4-hydroxybenzoate transporter-like MFS transporter